MDFTRWARNAGQYVFLSVIAISPLQATSIDLNRPVVEQFNSFEEFVSYIDELDDSMALEEIAKIIINFRQCLIDSGCICPSLCELAIECRDALESSGFHMEESEFDKIFDIFERLEIRQVTINKINFGRSDSDFNKHKHKHKDHKHKHKKKEVKMSGRMAVGFCKFLAGALCCVIPSAISQGAGIALMISGVTDMTKDILEPQQEAPGPLANPPIEYDRTNLTAGKATPILLFL